VRAKFTQETVEMFLLLVELIDVAIGVVELLRESLDVLLQLIEIDQHSRAFLLQDLNFLLVAGLELLFSCAS
jgi:hypothetical protein